MTVVALAVGLCYWFIAYAIMIMFMTSNASSPPEDKIPPWGIVFVGVFWLPLFLLGVCIYLFTPNDFE